MGLAFRLITPTSESLSALSASSSSNFCRIPEISVLLKALLDKAAREEFSLRDADRLKVDDLVGGGEDDAEDAIASVAEEEEVSRREEDLARAAEAALTSFFSTWPPHRRCFRSRIRASIRSR